MPTFAESCCCRGRRPDGIIARRHFSRPDLIARLLRDRHVARFIVAPEGFGKTTLAFEYADVVHSFQHVFWVNGRSPCFLRDLDSGSLLSALATHDPSMALVVLEDVPRLDDDRAFRFGQMVAALLDRKVEVVVTCVPSADPSCSDLRDRMLLRASDLLLSDEEMSNEVAAGRLSAEQEAACALSDRVACLRWADAGARVLMAGARREELPADVRLAMLVMLALMSGPLDDVAGFLPSEHADEIVRLLGRGYAFLGVDERASTYRAARLEVADLSEAFGRRLDELAASSWHDDRDALCAHIADMMLLRGQVLRACQFSAAFSTKAGAAAWAAKRGWEILLRCEPAAFNDLHASVTRGASGLHETLGAQQAWACFLLGDDARALFCARRVAFSNGASFLNRVRCLVLLMRIGTLDVRERAGMELAQLVDAPAAGASAESGSRAKCGAGERKAACDEDDALDWMLLARICVGALRGADAAMQAWRGGSGGCGASDAIGEGERSVQDVRAAPGLRGASGLIGAPGLQGASGASSVLGMSAVADVCADGVPESEPVRQARLLGATWLVDDFGVDERRDRPGASRWREVGAGVGGGWNVEELMGYMSFALAQMCAQGALSWCALCANSALERACARDERLGEFALSAADSSALRHAEVALFEQRGTYRRAAAARTGKRQEYQLTHPDAFRAHDVSADVAAGARVATPMLSVRLFGGLEVRMGDNLIAGGMLRRGKVKELLAVLVLSRGREIPKDRLAALLWPNSKIDTARRNLYSVWSQLRSALRVEGTCPYLIQSQDGCKLDVRLVSSDAYAFEGLCRALLFGTVETDNWESLYAQVCNEYADDLMPCEEDELISSMRVRYRMQLVDGLIAASARLGQRGEACGALWFAREALRRDARREDAYVALMEAQIAADQRGAALETYFACRRFLSEELGIDPSARIVELYRSVIEAEESLS